MVKTKGAPKRKASTVKNEKNEVRALDITSKRESNGSVEYLVRFEHTEEPAWQAHDEVDEDLVRQFEATLTTPLRRSTRSSRLKKEEAVSSPGDRKRKANTVSEMKKSKKITEVSSPSQPLSPPTPPLPSDDDSSSDESPPSSAILLPPPPVPPLPLPLPPSSSSQQPLTPTSDLRRGKSILTIDTSFGGGVEKVGVVKKGVLRKGPPKAKKGKREEEEEEEEEFEVKLSVGYSSLQGLRPTMEDAHTIVLNQKFHFSDPKFANKPVHYFAVYDGHAGEKVAEYLSEKLHPKIFRSTLFLQGNFQQAYTNAFAEIDREMCSVVAGGSTAACALLVGNTLTVANLGDAEIVLGYKRRENKGTHCHALLTHNVKPEEGQEVRRIEAGGGQVYLGRVNGEVAVSRAFGDYTYKRPTWKTDLISSVPYVNQTELSDNDRFLIISCDGLYEADVFTHESAVEFTSTQLKETKDPELIAKRLAEEAIKRGSHDNVTVIVVLLTKDPSK